jgi:hypothetical protein
MKPQQKISDVFGAENGADEFAVICSVLSTARKAKIGRFLRLLRGDSDQPIAELRLG